MLIKTVEELKNAVDLLEEIDPPLVGVDTETTSLDVKVKSFAMIGFSFAYRHSNPINKFLLFNMATTHSLLPFRTIFEEILQVNKTFLRMYTGVRFYYFPLIWKENGRFHFNDFKEVKPYLEKILLRKDKVFHNIPYDGKVFLRYGIRITSGYDTYVMEFLCDEREIKGRDLKTLSRKYVFPIKTMEDYGFTPETILEAEISEVAKYGGDDSVAVLNMFPIIKNRLEKEDLWQYYNKLEAPTSLVVRDMEYNGMKVDVPYLTILGENLLQKMEQLEEEIYEIAGHKFLISSPKQVSNVLFKEFKLPAGKVGKSGLPSSSKDALAELTDYPIVEKILKFKSCNTIKNAFVVKMPTLVKSDDRLYCKFNQCVTKTGRFSSSNMNLQNIPRSTEIDVRKAFIPAEGKTFIEFDYSQIELRMIAHFSQDPELISAYMSGRDLHTETASKMFNKPFDEVTPEERQAAKSLNFGMCFGLAAPSVAKKLKISVEEGQEFIDRYFEIFARLKPYMQENFNFVMRHGFIRTLCGRKRRFDHIINKRNLSQYELGSLYRKANNTKAQGSAADVIKLTMCRITEEFNNENVKIVCMVHDSLVMEVPVEKAEKLLQRLKIISENPFIGEYPLRVPLIVDIKIKNNLTKAGDEDAEEDMSAFTGEEDY